MAFEELTRRNFLWMTLGIAGATLASRAKLHASTASPAEALPFGADPGVPPDSHYRLFRVRYHGQ